VTTFSLDGSVVDPDPAFQVNKDPDLDPTFQVNPDPIRSQGFDDQKMKEKNTAEKCTYP
jgi:hypothetical protein